MRSSFGWVIHPVAEWADEPAGWEVVDRATAVEEEETDSVPDREWAEDPDRDNVGL
jgi:hypothetical protein